MPDAEPKRLLVIACEVFHRELSALAARSPRITDVVFLPKGLHDLETGRMRALIQKEIDAASPEKYDLVVLAYGLCNNGTLGLRARSIPISIPRAHDCITLFFGSRRRYREYFDANPGTYYHTTGWLERGKSDLAGGIMSQLGLSSTHAEYLDKYGRENADYIMQVLGAWRANYKRLTYIRMPIEGLPDYTATSRLEADENNWSFEIVQGDARLLEAICEGRAEGARAEGPEFAVVPPGGRLESGLDDEVFSSAPGDGAA